MESVDKCKVRLAIYCPPIEGLPFLSVAFISGERSPEVVPFETAAEAETYNKLATKTLSAEAGKSVPQNVSKQRADQRLAESLAARLNLKL